MFKLIKIQNSGINVPELEKHTKSYSKVIKAGEALIFDEGEMASCPTTTMPTHMSFATAGEDVDYVICYPITGDMLFETTIKHDPSALFTGSKVTLGKDTDNCSICVTADTNSGFVTIVDKMDATKAGDKVTVKF